MMTPEQIFDAFQAAFARRGLATTLDTAGLRELSVQVRNLSVFSARMSSAAVASELKVIIDQLSNDQLGLADARSGLLEALVRSGYTPEGGFPGTPAGEVPPAVAGTLQDLRSFRRVDLIVGTQLEIVNGLAQKRRGTQPEILAEWPAWELVRGEDRLEPRDWVARLQVIGREAVRDGGRTRIIFLKGDPAWGELGSSGNFDDALDVDHAPFAFSSGMVLVAVRRDEVERLEITGPDGESVDDFLASRPFTADGRQPLPEPRISTRGIDPALLESIRADFPDHASFERESLSSRVERAAVRAREIREAAENSAVPVISTGRWGRSQTSAPSDVRRAA